MASIIWRRQRALFFDNSLTIFFASLVVIVAIIEPAFLEWSNIQSILRGAAVIGIIASGMTIVMVAGGFDLSVARVAALCGIVVAQLNGYGPVVTIGAMLAVCIAIGLVNGTLIAKAKVNPFVVTLGMLSIASTLTLVVSSGRVIRDLDPWLKSAGTRRHRSGSEGRGDLSSGRWLLPPPPVANSVRTVRLCRGRQS